MLCIPYKSDNRKTLRIYRNNEIFLIIDKEGFYSIASIVKTGSGSNYEIIDSNRYFYSTSCNTRAISGEIIQKPNEFCMPYIFLVYSPTTDKNINSIAYFGKIIPFDTKATECKSSYNIVIPEGSSGVLVPKYALGCYSNNFPANCITSNDQRLSRLFSFNRLLSDCPDITYGANNYNLKISASLEDMAKIELLSYMPQMVNAVYIKPIYSNLGINIISNSEVVVSVEYPPFLSHYFFKPAFELPPNSQEFPNECTKQ